MSQKVNLDDVIAAHKAGAMSEFISSQKNEPDGSQVLMETDVIPFILSNESMGSEFIEGRVRVLSGVAVSLGFKGYSDNTSDDENGCLLYVEYVRGKLKVFVYSDINNDEPTHEISLQGAKITNRD